MPEEQVHREFREDLKDFRIKQDRIYDTLNELVNRVAIQNGRVTTNEKAITGILATLKEQQGMAREQQENLMKMLVGVLGFAFITLMSMAVWIFFDRTNTIKNISEAIQSIPVTVTLTTEDVNNLSK